MADEKNIVDYTLYDEMETAIKEYNENYNSRWKDKTPNPLSMDLLNNSVDDDWYRKNNGSASVIEYKTVPWTSVYYSDELKKEQIRKIRQASNDIKDGLKCNNCYGNCHDACKGGCGEECTNSCGKSCGAHCGFSCYIGCGNTCDGCDGCDGCTGCNNTCYGCTGCTNRCDGCVGNCEKKCGATCVPVCNYSSEGNGKVKSTSTNTTKKNK